MENKPTILKTVADWLRKVKLNKNEELICHADENEVRIIIWDNNNLERRTDARTKMENDRRHKLLVESRTGRKI